MNIAKAMYYNSVSPENINKLILNILKGYGDTKIRSLNYFDLFIIIPFYSYLPAQRQFKSIIYKQVNSFQRDIERNPNIVSNFNFRYQKSLKYIKYGILYALENQMILMDENMDISLNQEYKTDNKTIFNIGKVFSTKSTASLYNYFEVEINDI